ncbi:MAG: hypothetical protein KDB14_15290 [Planctomycetales bacterium]|nr:hypothetical protein [Planctomycetales bacterium]
MAIASRSYRNVQLAQAESERAFYKAVVVKLANVSGPPLAKVVSAETGEPVDNVVVGLTLIGPG